ncbi:MAG: hypothetical protein A2X86_05655 [Bdellovibrionales bacterium GWA2_49_15]|nr:MAG: hypothetical protein A2X86_05655 [Bdellovibrionales bacterium GWA2_49_15]
MNKKSLTILLVAICVFLVIQACQKQSPPGITVEYGRDDLERVEECKKVSFVKHLLYQENTLSLFKCLRWDAEFPELFKGIAKVKRENWNHIMAPISDVMLDNLDVRDQLIALVKRLDERGALDDLSQVITALNDTNFFDGLNEMFICARENNIECTRKDRALSKAQIKNLLKILTVENATVDAMHDLLVFVIDNFIDGADSFKSEVRKFYKNPVFKQGRVDLVTVISNILIEYQDFDKDREFIHSLLTKKDSDAKKLKIIETLESDNFDLTAYKNLVHFPLAQNLDLDRDFKVIKRLKSETIECSGYQNVAAIQLGPNLEQTLHNQVQLSKDQFFRALLDLGIEVKTASSFCEHFRVPEREITVREIQQDAVLKHSIKHKVHLIKFLKDYGRYLGDATTFDLMKLLIQIALEKPSIGAMYLIDVASSDTVSSALRLSKIIDDSQADIDSHIYKIIKNVKEPQIMSSLLLSEKFFAQKGILVDLARLWIFYSFEEKNIIFHYLDKHFEEEVNYVELMKFYLDAFSVTKDLYPSIASAWLSDDQKHEASYIAVEDFVTNLSGHDALKDFKKFLSRDYILKVIEILSKGVTQSGNALAELNAVPKSQLYIPPTLLIERTLSQNSSNVYLKCLVDIEDGNLSIWKYLQNPPASCKTMISPPPLLATINLLGEIESSYAAAMRSTPALVTEQHYLFDEDGVFAKANINSSVVLMDILDDSLKDQKNGISELLDTLKSYYYNFKFAKDQTLEVVLKKSLTNLVEILEKQSNVGILARTKVAKYLVERHRQQQLTALVSNLGRIMQDYAHYNPSTTPTSPKEFNFACRTELNQSLGENPCPSPSVIKAELNKSLRLLVQKYTAETPTALSLLLKAIIPQEGLPIPYEGKHVHKYWMTLKETMEIMYEMSDRSYVKIINGRAEQVNTRPMIYLEPDKTKEHNEVPKIVTSAERIETVIRDIRFDHNYLGAHYKNAVSKAEDYNKTVNIKYDLMKFCVGLGFCGKFFSKNEKRMAKNSIASYPSLLESNTIFGRGDWMQTLLQIFVASSDPAAQKSALVKFGSFEVPMLQSKEQLQKHNGQVVTSLSMLAIFSNGGRYFRDRIGKYKNLADNKREFNNYINGREMGAIDRAFLDHVNFNQVTSSTDKMLKAFMDKKIPDGRNLIDVGVDWFVSLKDADLVKAEKVFSKLLYLTTFVGTPNDIKARFKLQKFNSPKNSIDKLNEHFKDNNLTNVFYLLGELAEKWPVLYKASGDGKLFDFLVENDDLLSMFVDGLEKDLDKLSENYYYLTLNELFKALNFLTSFEGMNISRILLANLVEQSKADKYFTNLRQMYAFVNELRSGAVGRKRMLKIGDTVTTIFSNRKYDISPLIAYLDYTAAEAIRDADNPAGAVRNFHFDEPFKLIKFLIRDEYFHYEKLITHFFKTFFEDLKTTLKEMFASISVLSR